MNKKQIIAGAETIISEPVFFIQALEITLETWFSEKQFVHLQTKRSVMKIVLSLILCLLLVGCNNNKQLNKPESFEQILEDTLYKVKCYDLIPPIEVLKKWEDCPDSIITAFTRKGS